MGKNAQIKREAKHRAIQARMEKDKLKPSPPVFQIGERFAWKGVWFKIAMINGPEDVRLKIDGYTANYLDRGGEREFYVRNEKPDERIDDKSSTGIDSEKLVDNSGGESKQETSSKLERVSGEDSKAGRDYKVVQPERD